MNEPEEVPYSPEEPPWAMSPGKRALIGSPLSSSSICTCGHTFGQHGPATVDTDLSCYSCGCWGFEKRTEK